MQTFALYSITDYQLHYFCNLRTKLREYSLGAHLEFNYL